MESTSDILAIELGNPILYVADMALTQVQRDLLAERIEKVLEERRRLGTARRMQARLRQLQSLERSRERYLAVLDAD